MTSTSSERYTIVCPDLSENCLGRALVLAELASSWGETRIVGFQMEDKIWEPARSVGFEIASYRLQRASDRFKATAWLRKQLSGTKVIVSKPRMTSFGFALLCGVSPRQMILDIDDWELGLASRAALIGIGANLIKVPFRVSATNGMASTYLLNAVAKRMPNIIVSNKWLQRRYGGELVPHVRRGESLDPGLVSAEAQRKRIGISDDYTWVGFIGTIRKHKGLEDLIAALARTSHMALFLAGVADDPVADAIVRLARTSLGDARVRVLPPFPLAELPGVLAIPDIICIPSRDEKGAWGQIPAKLFDALAMGKPVVVTDVNDMREIVGQAGVVVPPGVPEQLAAALEELRASPERRITLGANARDRFMLHYSQAAIRPLVKAQLDRVERFDSKIRSSHTANN